MYKSFRDKFVNSQNSTISINDWNAFVQARSHNKLQDLDEKANIYLKNEYLNRLFFNLSISEIFRNTILVITLIFYEILALNTPQEIEKRQYMSYNKIFEMYSKVFLKDNRIIYVGTFLVLLSMFLMLLCINL